MIRSYRVSLPLATGPDVFPLGPIVMIQNGPPATLVTAPRPHSYVFCALECTTQGPALEERCERIRQTLAEVVGGATPAIPKLAVVAPGTEGVAIDFRARKAPGDWHPGCPRSGLMALATAALMPGTVVNALLAHTPRKRLVVRSPSGVICVEIEIPSLADDALLCVPVGPVKPLLIGLERG